MKLFKKAEISLLSFSLLAMPVTIHAEGETTTDSPVTISSPAIKKIELVGMNISKITYEKNQEADGYEIMRKNGNGQWKTIGTMGTNAQTYAYDGNIKKGTYEYAIKAYKKDGDNKIYSNVEEHVYKKTYKNVTKNLLKRAEYHVHISDMGVDECPLTDSEYKTEQPSDCFHLPSQQSSCCSRTEALSSIS